MRIRLLTVDDEPLAREKIRTMAAADPEIEIVGECANGAEAVAAVQTLRPELMLLDVQMPQVDGFAVLDALKSDYLPLVIFVTAFDHYAIQAFEVHALDYLLKPFDRERFIAAIEHAKMHIRGTRNGQLDQRILSLLKQLEADSKYLERLVVKTGGRVFFLLTTEIDWIEAEGNYVNVHTNARKSHLLRESISSLETQLDPKEFIRIHRSTIVNLRRIRELQPWSHGEYHVILHDGTELTLSRNYRDNLQNVLGNNL
ncbi:MAG: two-component system, LytTR family, response regulator [Pyrinomonadaceae bacterium]|nr:two-component system, LytTR family, response regulator [Pyrinomonadaceae bacterium]